MNDSILLNADQYSPVTDASKLAVAVLSSLSLVFILLGRSVLHHHDVSVSRMTGVTVMAAYRHSCSITPNDWPAACEPQDRPDLSTGVPFNCADWISTVPLLTAITLVLDVGRQNSTGLVVRMVNSAVLMLDLGSFGESGRIGRLARGLRSSTAPFPSILLVPPPEEGQVPTSEPTRVQRFFQALRPLPAGSWACSPLVCALPIFGLPRSNRTVLNQVGNGAADLLPNMDVGARIHSVACERTVEDRMAKRPPLPAASPVAA